MWCKCTKVQCLEVPTGQMSGQTRTPGIDATSTPGPFENGPKRGPGDGGSVPQRGGVDISQETTLFCFLFFSDAAHGFREKVVTTGLFPGS